MASGTPTEKHEQTAPAARDSRAFLPVGDLLKLHAEDRLLLAGKIRKALENGDANAARAAAKKAMNRAGIAGGSNP